MAQNARYQHIAFDGFEDYGTEACADDHFSFEQVAGSTGITDDEAHSGMRSIEVGAGKEHTLRKVLDECEN